MSSIVYFFSGAILCGLVIFGWLCYPRTTIGAAFVYASWFVFHEPIPFVIGILLLPLAYLLDCCYIHYAAKGLVLEDEEELQENDDVGDT